MLVDSSRIPAVRIFEAPVFPDERGFLLQSWVATDLAAPGEQEALRGRLAFRNLRPALDALRRNMHGMLPNAALLEHSLEEAG